MSESPSQVSTETWVVVVLGTAYYLGLATLGFIAVASTLPENTRITSIFLISTFGLSISIVYFIRMSRFFRPILKILWHRTSLYTQDDILPPKKVYKELRTAFSDNLKSVSQFVYLTQERYVAFIYFLVAVIAGLLTQLLLVRRLSTAETMDFAIETFVDGHGFSLLIAVLSLIEPIIGAAIILISLLGASGEETTILIAIVGIPAIVVVPGMWNAIALFEQLQYGAIRRFENNLKYNHPIFFEAVSDWLEKDIEEVYRMTRAFSLLAYLGVLLVMLLLIVVIL